MTVDVDGWLIENTDSPFWGAVAVGVLSPDAAEDAEAALKR